MNPSYAAFFRLVWSVRMGTSQRTYSYFLLARLQKQFNDYDSPGGDSGQRNVQASMKGTYLVCGIIKLLG